MTGAIRQKADALMRSEVAAYDSYLRGECYGFELYKNGELSDSCWGFMGNFSDVLKDMAAYSRMSAKGRSIIWRNRNARLRSSRRF